MYLSSKCHGVNTNITNIFWNKQYFLVVLELCYIEYKKVKFMAINFRGRTSVKYFMQSQLFWFCKDKSFFPFLVKNNY